MKTLVLLLLSGLCLQAATTIIDCGSPSDTEFVTGGQITSTPSQPPELEDITHRFGTFKYRIPVSNIPYVIDFHWVEQTVKYTGGRLFSVTVNNQLIYDKLDLYAAGGYMKAIDRSAVVHGANNILEVAFTTQFRSGLCNNFYVTPLHESLPGFPGPAVTMTHYTGIVMARQADNTWLLNAPLPAQSIANIAIHRNGVFQVHDIDYVMGTASLSGQPTFLTLGPKPGVVWNETDLVVADFDQLAFPLQAYIPWCFAGVMPGAGWSINSNFSCAGYPGAIGKKVLANLSLPQGKVGVPYTATLRAFGAIQPVEWEIYNGRVGGLTLDPYTGVLSGIPNTVATVPITFKVRDLFGYEWLNNIAVSII